MGEGDKPTILICIGALWPGNDASGPNTSIMHLARALADEFQIGIVARDRPFGAAVSAVAGMDWQNRGFARFRYCDVGRLGARGLGEVLRTTPHDVLWLNGFFDREFTIPALVMRRLGKVPVRPTIVSTRGEFAAGALGLKSPQKAAYLAVARRLGLLRDVCLHATSARELLDVEAGCNWAHRTAIAANVRPLVAPRPAIQRAPGAPLRVAFIGRVSRVKNLDYALEVLARVRVPVTFDIFGPMQDEAYGQACQRLIAALPTHVTAHFKGEIGADAVPDMLAATDLMFLPTKGENFGHAIFEALSCGVPVLVSDQTLWRDLEALAAGYDVPLQAPERFAAAIEAVAAMGEAERVRLSRGARALAERYSGANEALGETRAMLAALRDQPGLGPRAAMPVAVAVDAHKKADHV
jgi:glycosyltransferase involved in cell wall biosynthesis